MDKEFERTLKGLKVVYLGAAAAVAAAHVLPELPTGLPLVVMLGLAGFRLGRAVSFNQVFEPERRRIGIVTEPDSSGAGDNCKATGSGARRALGELVICPICSGQWAVAALALALILPGFGAAMVYILAAAGVSEVIHWGAERLEWEGRKAREESGLLNRQSKGEGLPILFSGISVDTRSQGAERIGRE